MKSVLLKVLKASALILAAALFLSLLSFSSGWSLSFDLENKTGTGKYQQDGLFTEPVIELDAEKIFGENMTLMLSKTVLNYLMVKNPEGPETVSTSTLTDLDRLKIRTAGNLLITARANQELKIYQETDLSLVPDSQQATDNYLLSLKKIFEEHLMQFDGEDLATLSYQAETQNDTEARKKLIEFINQTQLALDGFVQVPVPQSWKIYHLGLLNLYSEMQYTALGFLLVDDDPYRAKLVYGNYDDLAYRFYAFKNDFEVKQAEYFKIRQ
ncbi:MAG: hypothetical protein AB1721_01995 [Patescibacteria group bacterium]